MRFSRLGILAIIAFTMLSGAGCSYYNKIVARQSLVDGASAYKERKFSVAEQLFKKAVDLDPNGTTLEGKTAQLFLARTLHSMYISDRKRADLAESAVAAYQKVLASDPNDQLSFKALNSLLETLDRKDEAAKLVLDRSTAQNVKPEYRAEAFVSMAAKKYTCANDISDVEPVKKTVKKDGKDVYQYTKPTDPAQFDKLKACAADGMKLIEQAVALEPAGLKEAKDIDPATASPADVEAKIEMLKIFASAYSYRANLFYQNMRVAEMEGNTAEKDSLKAKGDEARAVFASFSEAEKKIETAKENKKKSDSEKKKEEEQKK